MEILGIFCPTYYPDRDIILLEQCDKPSLFQVCTHDSQRAPAAGLGACRGWVQPWARGVI